MTETAHQAGAPIGDMEIVLDEGLLGIAAAISVLDLGDPDVLDAYDRVLAAAESDGMTFDTAAESLGVTITDEMVALVLLGCVTNWGPEAEHAYARTHLWLQVRGASDPVLPAAGSALDALLDLQHADSVPDRTAGVARRMVDAYVDLAVLLRSREAHDAAARAAIVALHVAHPRHRRRVDAHEIATGGPHPHPTILRTALLYDFRNQVHLAAEDPARRLQAFDAGERVLLSLPTDDDGGLLGPAIALIDSAEWLRPLKVYALTRFRRNVVFSIPLPDEIAAADLSRIWRHDSAEESARALMAILPIVRILEDHRLSLQPSIPARQFAETSWDTMAFTHPAYTRAVPDSRSFLRERDLDELVLVLMHELTHVVTLQGGIGVGLLGFRLAALETELRIWGDNLPAMSQLSGLASPNREDVVALAHAERAVEIARKQRVLQTTWAPWFEGVAMIAELAADPTGDPHGQPMAQVLSNLVDLPWGERATAAGVTVQEVMRESIASIDARLRAAQQSQGRWRMRNYLTGPDRYAIGYLLVRAVLAAWRGTLGAPMTGAEAARLLTHITRFATYDAVPDLALPTERFTQACHGALQGWLRWACGIPRQQLEACLRQPEQPATWRAGHLVIGPAAEEGTDTAQLHEQLRDRVRQAFRTLGDADAAQRIRAASPECRAITAAVADAMGTAEPNALLLDGPVLDRLLAALQIVPLGSVEAPFWLDLKTGRLSYSVRTTEAHVDNGLPSYNGFSSVLDASEVAALAALVENRGVQRLQVSRVAVLLGGYHGMNVTVTHSPEWMSLTARGLALGRELSDQHGLRQAIWDRLEPDPLLRYERDVVAPGVEGARRTLDWLSGSLDAWSDVDGADVRAWAVHVRHRAERFLEVREVADDDAAWANLQSLLPGSTVTAIRQGGITALDIDGPGWTGEMIDVLLRSAESPCTSEWLDRSTGVAARTGELLVRSPLGWDVRAGASIR